MAERGREGGRVRVRGGTRKVERNKDAKISFAHQRLSFEKNTTNEDVCLHGGKSI